MAGVFDRLTAGDQVADLRAGLELLQELVNLDLGLSLHQGLDTNDDPEGDIAAGTTWQWQLTATIDTSVEVEVYDVDLFEAPQTVIDELKAAGVWTVGLAGDARTPYDEVDFTRPTAIVVGAEGTGLRRLVRERCDWLVSLPMRGHVDSLNVSVAAGITLFEAVRQRRIVGAKTWRK